MYTLKHMKHLTQLLLLVLCFASVVTLLCFYVSCFFDFRFNGMRSEMMMMEKRKNSIRNNCSR